ncbi:MAG: efflux RND transporter periplasmic adaptor subunit [Alistipes indistinctus]
MKRIVILLLAGAVCACARSSKSGETTITAGARRQRYYRRGARLLVLERLTTGKVTATPYRATFTTSGMVQAIPARYAEIATPFAGRIVKSFVRLGQKVVQGSPIFEISSPPFFDTGKAYYQASRRWSSRSKAWNREKDLLKNHVGVEKEVEEAEVNYELEKKDYENAVAALKVYQIDPGTMVLGQPLVVRSPIAGEVVKDNIVLGQYIKEDAGPLALVADLSKVWVVGAVSSEEGYPADPATFGG